MDYQMKLDRQLKPIGHKSIFFIERFCGTTRSFLTYLCIKSRPKCFGVGCTTKRLNFTNSPHYQLCLSCAIENQ